MVERQRGREPREVRPVLLDRRPVADVEHRRPHLAAHAGKLRGVEERHPDADGREHQEEGRKQTPRAVQPEASQAEAGVPPPLVEEQIGDQVAGQREEHADTEHPAARVGDVQVVGDDEQHRERADAVQRRHIAAIGHDWLRH
jgi:hypothetical protein